MNASRKEQKPEEYPLPLERRFENALSPFQAFINDQRVGSLLLLLCTLIALALGNSQYQGAYQAFVETRAGLYFGDYVLEMSLRHWVNDGLLALFFFVLGLEIKREVLVGELRDPQRSLPVIAAALGGMLMPALIYLGFNLQTATLHGWGIPMATDTAFAVGVLALLGQRIPAALFTFLAALAIIDDLGAILVIALFYSDTLRWDLLGLAGLLLAGLAACNMAGIRRPVVYLAGGFCVWLAMLQSGIHATVAGVAVAATVPARPKRAAHWFIRRARRLIDRFEQAEETPGQPALRHREQHVVAEQIEDSAKKATTPLRRWELYLEQPVILLVMPFFALTNAGIPFNLSAIGGFVADPLALGIVLGLVAGKGLGISLFTWAALRLRLGRLPDGVTLSHIFGVGLLGGMGFTMSIFIANLGFDDQPTALVTAKTAILVASTIAGLSGYLWLRHTRR